MSLFELEVGTRERAERGSKGVASRPARDGGRSPVPVAPPVLGRTVQRWRKSVWAPLALKAAGIVLGMLALAGIGAASLARGGGVPLSIPSASPAGHFVAGGMAPSTHDAGVHLDSAPPAAGAAAPAPAGARRPAAGARSQASGSKPLNDANPSDAGDAGAPPSSGITADGKVILNLASADEMRRLPGVGAKRALAIVELRARLGGRFKRVTDLLRVKGIGPKGLRKMEGFLVLDPPPDP